MINVEKRHMRHVEEALEPSLPIIDPHHHFWENAGGVEPFLHPRYMLDELFTDLQTGHNVVATVFLQCGAKMRDTGPEHLKPVAETEFVQTLADDAAAQPDNKINVAAGIISTADLCLGNAVDEVLDAHIAASPDRFKGIRFNAFWHNDQQVHSRAVVPEHHLQNPKLKEGAARLVHHGLTFETWLYHTQLEEFVAFAKALPDLTIIINHLGGPVGIGPYKNKADEVFADWSRGIKALSHCPNIYMKLGGINMETNGFDWDELDVPPTSDQIIEKTKHFYLHAIDCFGANRCMFESNFPMEAVAYPTLWNVFKKIAGDFSASEKASLFHNTAARAYSLPINIINA